jgi:hypothetical protein
MVSRTSEVGRCTVVKFRYEISREHRPLFRERHKEHSNIALIAV